MTHKKETILEKPEEIDKPDTLIYLASPYSHPDPKVREGRAKKVREYAAKLVNKRQAVYSPIAHWHNIAVENDLPKDWEFWKWLDVTMIDRCDELWALQLEGWESSKGLFAEVKYAKEHGIPVKMIDPTLP